MPKTKSRPGGRHILVRVLIPAIALTLLMAGLGLLLVHELSGVWPFTAEDGVDRALAAHRDRGLNDVSGFFSTVANTPSASALTALAVVVARFVYRRWHEALFIALAVGTEVSVFLVTTMLVHRSRPNVVELDRSPPTSSFPSGHTAAALALYGALALLVYLHTRNKLSWLLFLMPVAVGMARLYRGMHHPSDVVGGLLLGALSIVISQRAVLVPSAVTQRVRVRRTLAHGNS